MYSYSQMGVSKNRGTPKWMVKIMENPIKMDDLGGKLHYFRKHPNVFLRFNGNAIFSSEMIWKCMEGILVWMKCRRQAELRELRVADLESRLAEAGGFESSSWGVLEVFLFFKVVFTLEPETSTLKWLFGVPGKTKIRKIPPHFESKGYDVAIIRLMALDIVMFVANLIAQAWRYRSERRGLGVSFHVSITVGWCQVSGRKEFSRQRMVQIPEWEPCSKSFSPPRDLLITSVKRMQLAGPTLSELPSARAGIADYVQHMQLLLLTIMAYTSA